MNFLINITSSAQNDIIAIDNYIRNCLYNEQAANNLAIAIFKEINLLKQFPNSHQIVPDEYLRLLKIRAIPVKNYIVFYIVDFASQTVNIIRVLHSKQNWKNLIKESYIEYLDGNSNSYLLNETSEKFGSAT